VATMETIRPYVERLLEDSDVQEHLSRSAANLRAARRRAGDAKSKKRAVRDQKLHRRLATGAREAVRAGTSFQRAGEKQRRRERRRARGRFVLLVLTGAVAYLAVDPGARGRLLDAVGFKDPRQEADRK
jgi:hypothetical protein